MPLNKTLKLFFTLLYELIKTRQMHTNKDLKSEY